LWYACGIFRLDQHLRKINVLLEVAFRGLEPIFEQCNLLL
jgi:hypothetical protein